VGRSDARTAYVSSLSDAELDALGLIVDLTTDERTLARRRNDDLLDEGRNAFERGPGAARSWALRRLKLQVDDEQLVALEGILRSYEPPTAREVGEAEPARPVRRKPWITLAPWAKEIPDLAGWLLQVLLKRVKARRIDRRRQDEGRVKQEQVTFEKAERSPDDMALVTTTAAADEQDEVLDLTALLELAEARGLRLSPLEREVFQRRQIQKERYVDIAASLGKDAGQVRSLGARARRKLEKLRQAG